MYNRTTSKALILALAAVSTSIYAEEPAYTAKALFFGEVGEMKTVATVKAPPSDDVKAVTIATAPKKSVQKPKPVLVAYKAPVKTTPAIKAAVNKASDSRPLGAAYFVRLKKNDGALEDVLLANRVFSTGDRFQLGLKVNQPSYVYIFNEDPDGRITMLFPRPGGTAAVNAMGTVFLPTQGSFEFQGPAGTEKLLVLMSKDEMLQPDTTLRTAQPDLVAGGLPSSCKVMVTDSGNFTSKAIVYSQDMNKTVSGNCAATTTPLYASKAIVFSEDSQPTAGVQMASYVVKPQTAYKSEPLVLKIQLAHH